MDQYPAYSWMWSRRRLSGRSHVQSSYDDSWEEQAFAEDSSSALGGSIWPPRSYSCSFCRREFRSAQALGGHMNVHRRDRARLKQFSNTPVEEQSHHHLHNPNCGTSVSVEYPSRICTLIPNDELRTLRSTDRVTAPFIQDNCSEQKTLISPNCSFTIGQETNQSSLFSLNFRVSDSKLHDAEDSWVLREVGCQVQKDFVLTPGSDACLVDSIKQKDMDGDEEDIVMSKRRRIDLSLAPVLGNPKPSENMVETASLICFLKPNTDVRLHHLQSEVGGVCPSSIEHLDLELRLGDPPKVK